MSEDSGKLRILGSGKHLLNSSKLSTYKTRAAHKAEKPRTNVQTRETNDILAELLVKELGRLSFGNLKNKTEYFGKSG